MKILYVANGGFGDASWATSWPRIFSERGHVVDVFLMLHTGNPFHANPYIRNIFIYDKMKAAQYIKEVLDKGIYDKILIPDNNCGGVQEVIRKAQDFKNVQLFTKKAHDFLPPRTKPEWYFTENESKYIEDLKFKNAIVFHPLSSSVHEKSRNIDFDLIIKCSKNLGGIVVLYGGREYLPIEDLKRMEAAGIRLLWEGYNCFNDESGSALGKFLALTSQCRASVHAWSGSFTFSMGYNKPYVMVVPELKVKGNHASPFRDTKMLYEQSIRRARVYDCLNPSAWCITDKAEIIVEAIDIVGKGRTAIFNKEWKFIDE